MQSCPENFSETCSVPRRCEASSAQGDSSKLASVNPMEKVCSGFLCRTASAAMEVESTPPERNTPTGTSATRRFATAASSSATNSRAASSQPATGRRIVRRRGQLPVAAQPQAALVEHGHVRGGKLAHAAQDAGRGGNVLAGEVLHQRLGIELARRASVRDQRLELGAEDHPRAPGEVVERLLAQAIAREDELAHAGVPERQREHPLHALGELLAPLEVRAQHHLGVAAGGEGMTLSREALRGARRSRTPRR